MRKNSDLYNRIMEQVAKEVKKVLNEEQSKQDSKDTGDKMDEYHNSKRKENKKKKINEGYDNEYPALINLFFKYKQDKSVTTDDADIIF